MNAKDKFGILEQLSKATTRIMSNPGGISLERRLTLITKLTTELLNAEASEILLVERKGILTLEASYGHRRGGFKRGKEFAIRSGRKTGLTGHIAAKRKLFNAHGEKLVKHFAVRGIKSDHLRSGQCFSLLAIPLQKKTEKGEKLVGLLRVENKKSADDHASSGFGFTKQDELILNIFAEAIVAAIESAELVDQQIVQKDLLERLVTSSPDGIIAADEKGYVIEFNKRAEQILGYTAKEAMRKIHVSKLYYNPRDPASIRKRLNASKDGAVSRYKTRLISKNREVIPISLSATWLHDAKGQRIGSVGYFEDLRSIEEKEKHLKLLLKASNTISQAKTVDDGLQRLVRMLVSLIPCTFCRVLLIDESKQNLVPKAAYPVPRSTGRLKWDPELNKPIKISGWPELAGWLEKGRPWLITTRDPDSKRRLVRLSRRMQLDDVVESMLLVPLKVEGEVVGVLDLGEMRGSERAAFTAEKISLAGAIASQTAVLIHRIRLYEDTERHSRLLTAMDDALQHLRAEKDPSKLLQEFVRLAAELVGCQAGGFYLHDPHQKQLLLNVTYRLDGKLKGSRLARHDGLMAQVLQTGEAQIVDDYSEWSKREPILESFNFKQVIAVPLTKAGEIEAILFIGNATGRAKFTYDSIAVLKRFVTRSSVALHTAELMTSEQRLFDQLRVLHKISNYIQAAEYLKDILFVVVTGITAGYGLGFNRAALLLLDDEGKWLEGKMGIGHQVEEEARRAWEDTHKHDLYDLNRLLDAMKKKQIQQTPLARLIPELRMPLRKQRPDALSRVVLKGKPVRVRPSKLQELPSEFLETFQPATEVVIIPLISKEKVIGLLVADNKFTLSPITKDDINALGMFASSAAVAIDNWQLMQQTKSGVDKLRSSFVASAALISEKDPHAVLQDIVNRIHVDASASWVSLVLIDETGHARKSYTSGAKGHPDIANIMREKGNSMHVMRTNRPMIIEDARNPQYKFNPAMLKHAGIASALCLPVSLHNVRIGVMWMHYDQIRRFPQSEIEAWQLYVNHAAIAYDNAQRMDTLRRMRTADEDFAKAADSTAVLKQIVKSAREVLQAESSILWVYDHTRGFFNTEESVSSGVPPELWKEFKSRGPHPKGTTYAVLSKKFIEERDTNSGQTNTYISLTTRRLLKRLGTKRFLGIATRRLLERLGTRRFLGIALTLGKESLGVLYVNYKRPRKFRKEERETARAFADHATLALKKAKLLDDFNRAHASTRLVAEVTTLGDLEHALRSLVQGTGDALDCDAVTLYVFDPVKQRLRPEPIMDNVYNEDATRQEREVQQNSIVDIVLRRREMLVVKDVSSHTLFENSRFARHEKIVSCVGIPLKVEKSKVGVMFVNYRSSHQFTLRERENIKLFASQAAVAIGNAQLYEREQRQTRALEALHEAGRAVSGLLDEREILSRIAEQAWRISISQGKSANFASIRMVQGNKAILEAIYPKRILLRTRVKVGAELDLLKGVGGKIGVIGRAIQKAQRNQEDGLVFVPNVNEDLDYIRFHPDTCSELVVPIRIGQKLIGVINIEHPKLDAFDKMDQHTFEALAAQASVAIENSRQVAELKQAINKLEAKTWLAWIGIASAAWRHECNAHAVNIIESALDTHREIMKGDDADEFRIVSNLKTIRHLSERIKKTPLTPREVKHVNICDLIEKRINDYKKNARSDKSVRYELISPSSKKVIVKGSQRFLTQALDYLFENSFEAMGKSAAKELRVKIQARDGKVEIFIVDTGQKIPPEIQEQLFRKPVRKKKRTRGLGIGLLQAQAIVQAHEGDIKLVSTNSKGTTMLVWLPLMAESKAAASH